MFISMTLNTRQQEAALLCICELIQLCCLHYLEKRHLSASKTGCCPRPVKIPSQSQASNRC